MKLPILLILLFSFTTAFAHPGVSIVMDSKGNVFYTDLIHVWKIDKTTNKKVIAVRNVHTHELYIDKNDNVFGEHLWYIGDAAGSWAHYVWKYTPDGKFEKITPDTPGFLTNYSFVRDHHGTMYWADRDDDCHKVGKTDAVGKTETIGDTCMSNIGWMTTSPAGNVFLLDQHEVKKVDRQGHVVTVASAVENKNEDQSVMGLSTDAQENVYVAVTSERTVKKITPGGKVFTVARTGMTWMPTGILSTPDGDLWILECNAQNQVRVERITKDGTKTIY